MSFKPRQDSGLINLITGLSTLFGPPKMNGPVIQENPLGEYTTPPYMEPPVKTPRDPNVMIFLPEQKSPEDWKNWNDTWDIERNPDMPDLPTYPTQQDDNVFEQLGTQIRRAWHDVHKDFAFNAVQNHFPDFAAPEPEPDQSYHDYMDTMLQPALRQRNYTLPPMSDAMIHEGDPKGTEQILNYVPERDGIPRQPVLYLSNEEHQSENPVPSPPPAFSKDYILGEGEYFPSRQQIWDKMDEAEKLGLDPYEALGVAKTEETPWIKGGDQAIQQATNDVFGDGPPLTNSGYQPSPYEENQLSSYLDKLSEHEGGYNNDPNDRGGATKYGISTRAYNDLRQKSEYQTKDWPSNVHDLTKEQANQIYRNEYYYNFNLHKIDSDPVREIMTDMAVNNGYDQGTKILKDSLDETIGPKNYGPGKPIVGPKMREGIEEAEKKNKIDELVNAMVDKRIALANKGVDKDIIDPIFLKGLINRYNKFKIPSTRSSGQWIKGKTNF